MLKRLTFLVIFLALAWSGYWAWGASSLKSSFADWESARRADGWDIAYSDMRLRGFPNRHDTTWTYLALHDPDTGWGWEAPFFQLFLLSYNRHHAVAVWPPQQTIVTPGGSYKLESESLQASLVTEGADHALVRSNLVADVLNVAGPKGDSLAMAQLRAALSRPEGEIAAYDVALQIDGLALSAPGLRSFSGVPDAFQDTKLRARITFAEPWTLGPDARGMPDVTAIDLTEAALVWGPMSLRAAGQVDVDRKGEIEGKLTLRAENWRQMVRIAGASEQVSRGVLDAVETGLELIAQFGGSGENIDVTLTFRDGRSYIGILPIGPAPRLR